MNPMQIKTPEERRAIVAKGLATKRRNAEMRKKMQEEAEARKYGLLDEIERLESKLLGLSKAVKMSEEAHKLSVRGLARERDIVNSSLPFNALCGIYFLVKGDEVIYVGQSVNIYARVATHSKEKDFEGFSYIRCERHELDLLESLYIHLLEPPMNGNMVNGGKQAPLTMSRILALGA